MITFYNETQTPWGIEKIDDNRIKLTYERSYERINDGKEETVSRSFSILTFLGNRSGEEVDIESSTFLLSNVVNNKDPQTIFDVDCGIHFSPKKLTPFISTIAKRKCAVLLANIRLNGRLLSRVTTENADILDYLTFAGTLSFSSKLEINGKITVELYDEILKQHITMVFTATEDGVKVSRTNRKINKSDRTKIKYLKDTMKIKINKYRPKYPTKVIIVHPNEKEFLLEKVQESEHNIVESTKPIEDDVIASLKGAGYGAVTLYTNMPFEGFYENDEGRKYSRILGKLRTHFNIVFVYYSDGKVRVSKLN